MSLPNRAGLLTPLDNKEDGVKKIYNGYSEAIDFSLPKNKRNEDGKKLALFNSANHLELAVYKSNPKTVGGASSLFGLDYRDPVTVKFE